MTAAEARTFADQFVAALRSCPDFQKLFAEVEAKAGKPPGTIERE